MNVALILSGGTGTRLGTDTPKQYIDVCGKPIIYYCLESVLKHERIDAVQIVADRAWRQTITENVMQISQSGGLQGESAVISDKFRGFSDAGANRQLSILSGLTDILKYAEPSDYVLVHDAARPLLTAEQISECLDAVTGHDGVLPVLPMKDTVYYSKDGNTVTELLDRSTIYAGQAPELFVLGKYYEANMRLMPDRILGINGSTEPAVMAGMDIAMIKGDENNFKITTKSDLERFEQIIRNLGYSE